MIVSGLSYPSMSYPTAAATVATGSASSGRRSASDGTALSAEDAALLQKLKARDRIVRQHEQAHLAAAGGLATSAASFTYQRGPDGVNYAVGGEVHIDTSPGRNPEDTIRRAQTIEAAALAPADPSGQDRAVAAQAAQMEREARTAQASEPNSGNGADSGQKERLDRLYGMAATETAGADSIIATYA